jgi:hypothetical protein
MMRERLNDPELLKARMRGMLSLAGLSSNTLRAQPFHLAGTLGHSPLDLFSDPEAWMADALRLLAEQADTLRDTRTFRPLVVNPWPCGVHFADRIFGARVYELHSGACDWQAECLANPVGELPVPDLERDATVAHARRLARAFVDAGVSIPLFGVPVLSSPLVVGMNLYGQRLLDAMLENPVAARRDLRVITDVIKALHTWYRQTIPEPQLQAYELCGRVQPPGRGMLCGCSTQRLSPAQYAAFIAPLDAEILSLYPNGGLIHLCGSHTHLLPFWRAMKCVTALQVNDRAAEDLRVWFEGTRDDQVLYVNPCPGMPRERILEITGGRRTVVVGLAPDP